MGDGLFTFYKIVAVRNVALPKMFVMVIPTLGCRPIGTKAVKQRQIKDMDYHDIIIMSS